MIEEIRTKIPYKIDTIEKTDKGLTNTNYLVEISNKKYILRYPLKDIYHLFNPKNEEKVLNKLKGQDYVLPIKYYHDGVQIVEYRSKLVTFDEMDSRLRIKEVASLMQKFHQSNINVDFSFDPISQINLYKNHINDLKIDLNEYSNLLDRLSKHKYKPVLCHNDWVEGNICFINNKSYLIDFEYAGNNDRLFDVMSFLTENDLTIEERHEFLSLMFINGICNDDYQTLKMYRDVNNLLWYLWAEMMHDFRNESIYKDIAKTKYEQLTSEYNKDLWGYSQIK